MAEVVQTIKQNNSGIRNTPGTALKIAINGEIIYTLPCCEDVLRDKLTALEQFINDTELSTLHPLVKMALIHYQFEAIHPFADRNSRTGRIINALYLVQQELLSQPVLYISSYIVKYKAEFKRPASTERYVRWYEGKTVGELIPHFLLDLSFLKTVIRYWELRCCYLLDL
jgi:Fic family protein